MLAPFFISVPPPPVVLPFMLSQFIIMFAMVFFPWLVTGPARLFHGG